MFEKIKINKIKTGLIVVGSALFAGVLFRLGSEIAGDIYSWIRSIIAP